MNPEPVFYAVIVCQNRDFVYDKWVFLRIFDIPSHGSKLLIHSFFETIKGLLKSFP